MQSWIPVPSGSDFPIENLPFGIVKQAGSCCVGVAIGDRFLNLAAIAQARLFDGYVAEAPALFAQPSLNALLAAGRPVWSAARARVSDLLSAGNRELLDAGIVDRTLLAQNAVEMVLPVDVTDYVDFYSSLEHASNVGKILRPGSDPIAPNWRYLPIGYHGRSANVVVSGTPVVRPRGQTKASDTSAPAFGPSRLLDIEAELGFITGNSDPPGAAITADQARNILFGVVLLNDWSARDIQAWESVPLGPFLAKSFATSISPWVVTIDALAPYRVDGPRQAPPPLPHLAQREPRSYAIDLTVSLQSRLMQQQTVAPKVISRTTYAQMYWSIGQALAHLSSNGSRIRAGDLYGSGTISGPTPDSLGSLLEMTWRGTRPLTLGDGTQRAFLEDGDTVTITGACGGNGQSRIGFGAVRGTIVPSPPLL